MVINAYALLLTITSNSLLTGDVVETHRVVAEYPTRQECVEVARGDAFKNQLKHVAKNLPNVILLEGRCVRLNKPEIMYLPKK